jgi:hypothetical protein
LITLNDVRPGTSLPAARTLAASFTPPPPRLDQTAVTSASPAADRLLHACLYLCTLSGFFIIIQPAPYEGLAALLGLACVIARVRIDGALVPMILLLTLIQVAGLASGLPVLDDPDVWNFMGISIYLALTAPLYGAIMTQDTMRRLSTYRAGVVFAAVIAALLGMVGYFQLIPQYEMFMMNNRAVSTFKDPNIFGPFLVPPLLLVIERFIGGHLSLRYIIAGIIIAVGLLLVFSRGAWGNFSVSLIVMLWLLFVTAPDRTARRRIFIFVFAALAAVVVLGAILYSIESVRDMLLQRAKLVQEYDAGTSGARFNIQQASINEIIQNPNGMGGWVFARIYGLVTHNSYLGTFLNHGWIGGFAYIGLTIGTLIAGFRCSLVRTPWQTILIALYTSYIGLALESFIVDTDHFRLYFQLIGVVWGLIAATMSFQRSQRAQMWSMPATPSPGFRLDRSFRTTQVRLLTAALSARPAAAASANASTR